MQGEPKKDYLKELKKRTIWRRIVACLAVVVAVSTGYALILPAVTMEQQAVSESKKETEADWEGALPDALTGEWGTDLAAVAQSQVGYAESSTDTAVNDAGEACGYTRYGAWYGEEYGDWNGMFLAFCLHYAEIPEDAVKASADVSEMLKAAQEKGFYKEAGQYEPEVGDIAFLPDTQAGIVTAVSPEGVSVTAGDINGTVAVIEKAESLGYGSMETANRAYVESQQKTGEEDSASGQDGGTVDGITDSESENQPSDDGMDPAIQTGQSESSEGSQIQKPENGAEQRDELADGENETAEQNEETNLEEYVLTREFGNEKAQFVETLLDANGQEVERENGKYQVYPGENYTWSISLYAPLGIPDAGIYYYNMPEGITASDISPENVTADDGTVIGTLEVADGAKVVVRMDDNTKIRVRIYFEISVFFEEGDDGKPLSPIIEYIERKDDSEGEIEKTHILNSEGNFEWTITARIPGYSGTGKYASWYIRDNADVGGVYQPDLSSGTVTISYGEESYELPSVTEAGPEDDIAYWWGTDARGNRILGFVTRRTSHDSAVHQSFEGLDEDWCADWTLPEDAVITVKYIDQSIKGLQEGNINVIDNVVRLHKDGSEVKSAQDRFKMPPVIGKEYTDGQFVITFNEEEWDLSGSEPVVVNDSMQGSIFYRLGSINVTASNTVTGADGEQHIIEQTLMQGADRDYTLDVSDDLKTLTITILHPGAYKYQITYDVMTTAAGTGDSSGVEYENTASVEIFGRKFDTEDSGTISNAGSSAEEYVVSIRKTDVDLHEAVPGAVYGLYSSHGELLAQETTGTDGTVQFKGDPSAGFMLSSNQLYYFEEITAPEGYQLSNERYWFYYSDSDGGINNDGIDGDTDNDLIDILLETAKVEGYYRDGEDIVEVKNKGYINEDSGESSAVPIEVQDQLIWYELPETGSTGTRMYTIAGLLLTGSAVTALYREKCKKRRNKK